MARTRPSAALRRPSAPEGPTELRVPRSRASTGCPGRSSFAAAATLNAQNCFCMPTHKAPASPSVASFSERRLTSKTCPLLTGCDSDAECPFGGSRGRYSKTSSGFRLSFHSVILASLFAPLIFLCVPRNSSAAQAPQVKFDQPAPARRLPQARASRQVRPSSLFPPLKASRAEPQANLPLAFSWDGDSEVRLHEFESEGAWRPAVRARDAETGDGFSVHSHHRSLRSLYSLPSFALSAPAFAQLGARLSESREDEDDAQEEDKGAQSSSEGEETEKGEEEAQEGEASQKAEDKPAGKSEAEAAQPASPPSVLTPAESAAPAASATKPAGGEADKHETAPEPAPAAAAADTKASASASEASAQDLSSAASPLAAAGEAPEKPVHVVASLAPEAAQEAPAPKEEGETHAEAREQGDAAAAAAAPPIHTSTTTTTTGTPSAFNVEEPLLAPVPTGRAAQPLASAAAGTREGEGAKEAPAKQSEEREATPAAEPQQASRDAEEKKPEAAPEAKAAHAPGTATEASQEREQPAGGEAEKREGGGVVREKVESQDAAEPKKSDEEKAAEAPPSQADMDKAAAAFVKKEGGVPLEAKLADNGPELTEEQTKTFVDTQEVAQNVRKLIGLKAGSNLHLENQKLIEPDCDLSTFGPDYCAAKENPNALKLLWSLEHRKNNTYFVIALITLAFGIAVQTCIRLLEKKISEGKDQFSKEVMETAFRQIATISIVNVILWGTMQSNIAEVLDELIFGDVMPPLRDSDTVLENVSPMLEVLFEELFFVAVILLVWYVLFVIVFQCFIRQIIDWMRKTDEEEDIPMLARAAETQSHKCCGSLIGRNAIEKANFIAHRYSFADNVSNMSIPGVDPSGYYFMEYLRASLLKMGIEMIRLPNSTLFFLMVVGICLRPTFSFRLGQEAGLITGLSAACLIGMLLVWAHAKRIEKQLLPRHVPHYLVMRYHMEVGEDSRTEYLKEFMPPYKLQKQKNAWPGVCSTFVWGTTLPNKHQQLFWFWANGPTMMLRAVEATFFCQLLVLAWWVQLFRSHPATWLTFCWWANPVIALCALLQILLLKSVVYTILLALNSGMLIDPELLEKVWDLQRAENVRRTAELIDALRVQSTLFAISEGGDMFWRQLLIRSKSATRQVQEQRLSLWAGLDEEHHGEINRAKISKFLTSQGLPVRTEAAVNEFLHVFDRTHKGGLNEEEFFVMVMVVKQMLMEPLDRDAVRALFEGSYGIPWTSPVGIDLANLSKILAELRLTWSEGKKRYLLDFIGGKRGITAVSPEHFVAQLQAMEEQALNPMPEGAACGGASV
ncbi:hypothetical protein BESB_010790 [Besnoitia besnoiti]|uniref:Transmembrane protein n=1 Tax=Besnoitia besnoiti TaxID=94643 RepID=A0A2A9MQU9_BESBE|nr:hypothetical protein BESB_010790 [Besnoitia besnoiti]PFH38737.1 hypothetical protein BESB_010790 [Besnoitia besnoiti]